MTNTIFTSLNIFTFNSHYRFRTARAHHDTWYAQILYGAV